MWSVTLSSIKRMQLEGMSVAEIAKKIGVSEDWLLLVTQTDGWRLVEADNDSRSGEPGGGEDIRQDGEAEGSI